MTTVVRFALCVAVFAACSIATAADKPARMMSHDVYFTLKDNSPDACEALVGGCKKFLAGHSGVVWFAAGALVREHEREVNDRDFDVALHIVFRDKAAHDKYQNAEAHHKFIEEFQENWESVRVFDSWLSATLHGDEQRKDTHQRAKELRLPDAAASFAGMIEAKVVAATDRGLIVEVEKIARTWRHSKAKDAEALVGKAVLIRPGTVGRHAGLIGKFLAAVKPGEQVELDVAHREGEALVLLELTESQRRRVAD